MTPSRYPPRRTAPPSAACPRGRGKTRALRFYCRDPPPRARRRCACDPPLASRSRTASSLRPARAAGGRPRRTTVARFSPRPATRTTPASPPPRGRSRAVRSRVLGSPRPAPRRRARRARAAPPRARLASS
eukprot:31020-Pelagococcus_subviridis.AAC.19